MRSPHTLLKATAILFLLTSLPLDVNASAVNPSVDNKDTEWAQILSLYDRGVTILNQQAQNSADQALWEERRRVFLTAAEKLAGYISRYERDQSSPTFLRTNYRLGTFYQIAYRFDKAKASYLICKRNRNLLSTTKLDGMSLAQQVEDRLREIERDESAQPVAPGFITRTSSGGLRGIEGGPLSALIRVFEKIAGANNAPRVRVPDDTARPQVILERTP